PAANINLFAQGSSGSKPGAAAAQPGFKPKARPPAPKPATRPPRWKPAQPKPKAFQSSRPRTAPPSGSSASVPEPDQVAAVPPLGTGPAPAPPTSASRLVTQTRRYLRVRNATDKPLQVYVRYRTLNDQNKWQWFPGEAASGPVVVQKVAPGQAVD